MKPRYGLFPASCRNATRAGLSAVPDIRAFAAEELPKATMRSDDPSTQGPPVASSLPDDALARAQLGDPAAFEQIYLHLSPLVHGYFTGRGAEDAESLTQEVFLTVFTRLASVRGEPGSLRTFVFSVAHARHVDEVRRRARRPVPVGYDPDADFRTSPSAESVALERLGGGELEELLRSLKAEYRDVLLLRVVAGLSLEQVAEVVGRSTGSVKQLQRRALIRLRELVELDEEEAS
jgi:RNA polymerase sigma factor (sigma-70 family)